MRPKESDRAYLSLLHAELETLDRLHKAGVIPQYTRMDIRSQIQNERDRLCLGDSLEQVSETGEQASATVTHA